MKIVDRIASIERLLRMRMPQVWDLRLLREHYPAWSDAQIRHAAATHTDYRPTRGKPLVLTLAQVEQIDLALRPQKTP